MNKLMKLGALVALVCCLSGCRFSSSFHSNLLVDANETSTSSSTSLKYHQFKGTRTHSISLKKGQTLSIQSNVAQGDIHFEVKDTQTHTLYESEALSIEEHITLPSDDEYVITITSDSKDGEYHISWE